MKKILTLVMLVGGFALIAACGSSATNPAGDTGGGNVAEINNLADVPDEVLDPSQYDHTINSGIATNIAAKGVGKVSGSTGGFSRAGCETNQMKKNMIRNALMPKMVLCYMQGIETAMGATAAGSGTYNYWKGDAAMADAVEGPPDMAAGAFKPRMAIKKDGEALTFVMCNETTKTMELYISTASGKYSGHAIDDWGGLSRSRIDFEADGTPDDFTLASFTQSFIEAREDGFEGYGSSTLGATPAYNSVSGYYHEGGNSNSGGAVYSAFDDTQGTARFKQDAGYFPAQTLGDIYSMCVAYNGAENCGTLAQWIDPASGWVTVQCGLAGAMSETPLCFSNCVEGETCCPVAANEAGLCEVDADETAFMESFTIDNTDTTNLIFAIAETSIYAELVAAATMPDSGTSPTIAFEVTDVDCAASDSWTAMVFTAVPNVAACVAMNDELDNWQADQQNCWQQEGAKQDMQ